MTQQSPTVHAASEAGPTASDQPSRRSFFGHIAAGTGVVALSRLGSPVLAASSGSSNDRQDLAERIRLEAAKFAGSRPVPSHPNNGDEQLYGNKIGSYSKGLPHNNLGEVNLAAYSALITALTTGSGSDFERIPLGLGRRLVNPQAAFAFDLEGADSHSLALRPAPPVAGAEAAAELAEVYWMALARDVNFSSYDSDPVIAAAAQDLSRFSDFRGPKNGGQVTPDILFRGDTAGDLIGPYLSQFLWLNIPMGAVLVEQLMYTLPPNFDYMTSYGEWLNSQNGFVPAPPPLDPTPRHIRNLRDLAQWVHVDALYQAYHQACLILLHMGAPVDAGNPYTDSRCQEGFGTFGGPHILSLVTEVATRALKAAWYQKWLVHRRPRPEAMAGLVHHTMTGTARYPIHADILNSQAVRRIFSAYGTYLLPMAFPEGSPTHPSYAAGHATVAGACVTILKAWFDESFVLPNAVTLDPTGHTLVPYAGPPLTVGNELNKLATNVGIGRNGAGVHYRSDDSESMRLGESVAISILEEQKATYNERATFTLTKFDGTTVTV